MKVSCSRSTSHAIDSLEDIQNQDTIAKCRPHGSSLYYEYYIEYQNEAAYHFNPLLGMPIMNVLLRLNIFSETQQDKLASPSWGCMLSTD